MSKNLVIIPTYNEKENAEAIIRKVFSLKESFHVLIVDDGSPDGTADIVKGLQKEFPLQLHLLQREGKQGLGTAYIAGFRFALDNAYEYICEMDADFSHNPEDLVRLQKKCDTEGADVAIGSRYITGVNVVNWPMGRVLLSFYASKYVRIITGMKVKDATAGFVCYRKQVLETINLDNIRMIGYAFQIEMKFKAWLLGFDVQEVPIIFTERKHGSSKMSGGIFSEAVFGVISMRLKSIFNKQKYLK
ncbi:MAG TPA: polyprenol monophosphomannose synthase [Bacteroidales bacterium]|nr:polyprenol monophosphomannose synthase [Bacteroidales bacterium]